MTTTRPTTPARSTTPRVPIPRHPSAGRIAPPFLLVPKDRRILAWQDDPLSGLHPIDRPVPLLAKAPLPIDISWPPPPPAQPYHPGTWQFRYWTAADALRRCADFWAGYLPPGTWWQTGPTLRVILDAGMDLNAAYTRRGLNFYHQRVDGAMIYSAESPDVVSHELGHGVLDAIRPQLWHTASLEVAAFHEAFGDISAILSALALPSLRGVLLQETGALYRSSTVSRLAEQLGWAIRRLQPDAVGPDCLRNAVNSFVYADPQDLPSFAPASTLSSEPHSLSQVFSGAVFEGLCLMTRSHRHQPTDDDLRRACLDMGRLLVDAIRTSPVVPEYFSQVAAHMLAPSENLSRSYRRALESAFLRHGVLTVDSLPSIASIGSMWNEPADRRAPLPRLALAAKEFGLGAGRLIVQAAGHEKRFMASSVRHPAHPEPATPVQAATRFVRSLVERGAIGRTHQVSRRDGRQVLERIRIHGGGDPV